MRAKEARQERRPRAAKAAAIHAMAPPAASSSGVAVVAARTVVKRVPKAAPRLVEGDWLDVMDSDGIWNVAQVLRLPTADTVEVKFDCWGDEYNEELPRNSARIAPFHTFTWTVKCWAKHTSWPWWPALVTIRTPGSDVGALNLRLEERLLVDFLDQRDFTQRCRCWVEKHNIVPLQYDEAARERHGHTHRKKKKIHTTGISHRRRKEFDMSGELLLQSDAKEEFPAFAEGTLPAKSAGTTTRPTAALRRSRGEEAWLGAFLKNRLFHSATHAYTTTVINVGNGTNREKILLMASDGAIGVDGPNQPTKSGKAAKKAKTVVASMGTSNSPSDSRLPPHVKEATHRLVRLAPKPSAREKHHEEAEGKSGVAVGANDGAKNPRKVMGSIIPTPKPLPRTPGSADRRVLRRGVGLPMFDGSNPRALRGSLKIQPFSSSQHADVSKQPLPLPVGNKKKAAKKNGLLDSDGKTTLRSRRVVESRSTLLRLSPSKADSSTIATIHKSSANGLQPSTGDDKTTGAEGSKETCYRSSMPQKRVKKTHRLSTFHGDALAEPSKPVKRAKITDYIQTAVATSVCSAFQTRGGASIAEEGKSGDSTFLEDPLHLPPGKRVAVTSELGRRRDNDDAPLRPSKKVKTSAENNATSSGEPIPKGSIPNQNVAEKNESEQKRQDAGKKNAEEALMTQRASALVGPQHGLGRSFNSVPDPEGKQHAANPNVTKPLPEEGSPKMGLERGSFGEAFDVLSHLKSGPTTLAHPSQTVEANARPSTRLRVHHPPSGGDELKPTPVDDSLTSHKQELAKAAVGNNPAADAVHSSQRKSFMERRTSPRKQDAERPPGGQREATLETSAGVHSGVPVQGRAEEKWSHTWVDERVYIAPRKYGKTPKELKAVKKAVVHLPPYVPPCANLLPEARKRKGGKGRAVLAHASTTKESLRPTQMEKTSQHALKEALGVSRHTNSGLQRGCPRSGKGAASANQTHDGAARSNAEPTISRNRCYQAGTSDVNEQGGTRRGNANGHGARSHANTSGILLAAKRAQAARWGNPLIGRGSGLQSNLTILADDRTSNSKIDDGPASPMEHLSRLTQHTLQADGDLHFLEKALEEKIAEFVEKSSKVEHLRCKFPGSSTPADREAMRIDLLKDPGIQAAIVRIERQGCQPTGSEARSTIEGVGSYLRHGNDAPLSPLADPLPNADLSLLERALGKKIAEFMKKSAKVEQLRSKFEDAATAADRDAMKHALLQAPGVQAAIARIERLSRKKTDTQRTKTSRSAWPATRKASPRSVIPPLGHSWHAGLESDNTSRGGMSWTSSWDADPWLRPTDNMLGFQALSHSVGTSLTFSLSDNFSIDQWYRDLYPRSLDLQRP